MGSVLLRRQRLAAELAITSGKSRDFASTTITASRKASKTASVNGRVALLANRTYSGDVAIHWYSGQLKSDHLYAFISTAHIPRVNMRDSLIDAGSWRQNTPRIAKIH